MRSLFVFLLAAFLFSCHAPESGKPVELSAALTDTAKRTPVDSSDRFLGKMRAQAKTSFVGSPADTFTTIKALRKWLPADKYMHERTDARRENAPRTGEENKNVALTDVYLFGVKREDDNDYHLILCSAKRIDKDNTFFSAEISALPDPADPSYARLAAVRSQFQAYFGDDAKKELVFAASKKKPPIHLSLVAGSLFFDNHHYSGHSSVQGYRSCSAWEIHPVTAIRFD